MAIIIGSARIDENGNATGGEAGDQKQISSTNDTSGEVSMQNMYVHSKGWYVLRPKSVTYANKIAERMKTACNNANIGYDQSNRLGIISAGIDTKTKTECDCSSLVRACVKEATGKDPGNFTTANEVSVLSATGLFEDKFSYTSQSATPIANGDILTTKTQGHTCVVVSGNQRTEAAASSSGSNTKLTVDGSIGPATVKRLQQYLGTTQDSFISGQPSGNKKYWEAVDNSVCKWSGGTSQMVKAMQKLIGVTQDGYMGQATAKAMQKYLINKGYSCGSTGADGYFGKNSAKALQNFLNAN